MKAKSQACGGAFAYCFTKSFPMGRSSSKQTVQFWLLLVASILLSAMVISLFLHVMKVMIYLLLVLLLAPMIYLTLKNSLPQFRGSDTKLKSRN
ncbi:hypothetical protein [Rufibacter tibetensis]|uniref:Uncharacterized protein n=1 Tax=Rufibacter tibetensis TaxID=512763 RepID=A0A0P0CVQ0_9BACT|nr:hypothetical protein [Rufibacter tibetensis]ALI98546.1 hypothetical protein DC20_05630 [Rufibacter tibetensis]